MPLTGQLSNDPRQAGTLSHQYQPQKQILVFNRTWSTGLPFLLFVLKHSAGGRKDFLPVEPQSCLSFLFLLGTPKVRLRPLLFPSVWPSPDVLPPPRRPLSARVPSACRVERAQR